MPFSREASESVIITSMWKNMEKKSAKVEWRKNEMSMIQEKLGVYDDMPTQNNGNSDSGKFS